ncbi:hypothetical protein CXG81DRAFT_3129, partial [Caulochytrium protostelioides]
MSGVGTGYDLSSGTYSPDGRVFQVEYAVKAVENAGTVIGIRCKDGVVLAAEKLVHSKLLTPKANRQIQSVDRHAGICPAGLLADGRQLAKRAQEDAANYRANFKLAIPGRVLASNLAAYVQAFTLYSSVRPFGVSAILACYDDAGPSMYTIDPTGVFHGYYGAAVGKGRQVAKVEIEKLDLRNMTAKQAVFEVARILHIVHDDAKDKDFEMELSWVCDESKRIHTFVPEALAQEAEAAAKAATDDMD